MFLHALKGRNTWRLWDSDVGIPFLVSSVGPEVEFLEPKVLAKMPEKARNVVKSSLIRQSRTIRRWCQTGKSRLTEPEVVTKYRIWPVIPPRAPQRGRHGRLSTFGVRSRCRPIIWGGGWRRWLGSASRADRRLSAPFAPPDITKVNQMAGYVGRRNASWKVVRIYVVLQLRCRPIDRPGASDRRPAANQKCPAHPAGNWRP